jgi:hypothetical protein
MNIIQLKRKNIDYVFIMYLIFKKIQTGRRITNFYKEYKK